VSPSGRGYGRGSSDCCFRLSSKRVTHAFPEFRLRGKDHRDRGVRLDHLRHYSKRLAVELCDVHHKSGPPATSPAPVITLAQLTVHPHIGSSGHADMVCTLQSSRVSPSFA
jgi:hypothetical protein